MQNKHFLLLLLFTLIGCTSTKPTTEALPEFEQKEYLSVLTIIALTKDQRSASFKIAYSYSRSQGCSLSTEKTKERIHAVIRAKLRNSLTKTLYADIDDLDPFQLKEEINESLSPLIQNQKEGSNCSARLWKFVLTKE